MSYGVSPSEGHHTSLSIFENYPAQFSRLSKRERKDVKDYARTLYETSPGDAQSYLATLRGFTNFRPESLMAKLGSKPIDYDRYKLVGATAFQDLLGRSMTNAEWEQTSSLAKTMGIKDPDAFESFLSRRLASTPEGQAKIKSEADIAWESQYGTMPRDSKGNLIRGMVRYNPGQVKNMIQTMIG